MYAYNKRFRDGSDGRESLPTMWENWFDPGSAKSSLEKWPAHSSVFTWGIHG